MSTIHIVPHTHWDREWYEPFQVFRMRLVHLIDLLLDILDREPAFTHFTLDGQTIVLDDYLAVRPERAAEIKRHVRNGTILIGPWHVLPDEFLVSPEALVRNLLLGSARCRAYGARMDVGYIPDPFGHIGQMPQILRGFGITSAGVERGLDDHAAELWWESCDGSRVLLANLRDGYDNAARMPTARPGFSDFVRQKIEALDPHCQTSHRLLLNGTDHHEPQPEIPELVTWMASGGSDVRLSSLPAYVAGVREEVETRDLELPVVRGELRSAKRHHLLAGVLSSRVWIKQRNDACQTLLERWAEPFSAWVDALGLHAVDRSVWTGHLASPRVRHPAGLLREAWRLLLTCHPHDSICGCSIDQVHDEMRSRFDQVEQIGEEITHQSLVALAQAIDTLATADTEARGALVVFNPADLPHTGMARARLELPAGLDPFCIRDSLGREVPYRVLRRRRRELADLDLDRESLLGMLAMVEEGRVLGLSIQAVAVVPSPKCMLIDVVVSESGEPDPEALQAAQPEVERWTSEGKAARFRLLAHFATQIEIEVLAQDVPPHGYASYTLLPAATKDEAPEIDSETWIENGVLRAEVDEVGQVSLTDSRTGTTYPGLLRFRDVGDRGDSYTFCPLIGDRAIEAPAGPVAVQRARDSCGQELTLRAIYAIPRRLTPDRSARSEACVEVPIEARLSLLPGSDRVDVDISLENRAEDHRLQVLFPLPFEIDQAAYGGHFEVVKRGTSLPAFDEGWIEAPSVEQPMRGFIAASRTGEGLALAARGLHEAAAHPDGVVSVTLLRSTGWLSRDDLTTRRGGAGPTLETPGGQCLGAQAFHFSLIPFQGHVSSAAGPAEAYRAGLRAVATGLHAGTLPPTESFLATAAPGFALSAVKAAEDGAGLVVRGVNLRNEPIALDLEFLRAPQRVAQVRLDETEDGPRLELRGRHLTMPVRGGQVLSLRVSFEPEAPTSAL